MPERASEQSIFLHVLDLPSATDRAAYLDEACRDNAALRKEIDALLAAHDRLEIGPSPTTDQVCGDDSADEAAMRAALNSGVPETAGAVVSGRYKLLEQIGEGGMGSVWMAQQQEPVKRLVAVKLVKAGMDSKQVLARFEAERQALALMDHPNIARVLDAGTTAAGNPYFVMELVKGIPITSYCDEHQLTPRQRLELFLPVCQAIQHAHQKGIIHRDIKPSNVLVASYDGRPVPKVIDFGIAKAAGQPLTDRTLVTGFGMIVGTLEYMSPEQAMLNALDIDTRSDVYSLGVLLYELLTGTTPLEKKRLREAAMVEVLRLIREEEPPRPSTRLSTTDELPSVAANRGVEPKKLSGLVKGELDWIVMKALEKDRNRRYESANGFAADIQRYLADEAVQACPPSMGYRVRKFVRRHKGPVLAGSVFVLLLVLGIAGTTIGLVRALAAAESEALARRQTREALDTTVDTVMEDLLGRQVRLTSQHRKFFQKVLEFQEAFAASKANDLEALQSRAAAYFRVGRFRGLLGQFQESELAYRHAVDLQKQLVDGFPERPDFRLDLAASQDNLGILLVDTGRREEARVVHDDALKLREKLVADFPDEPIYRRDLARSHLNLGRLHAEMGRAKEAERDYSAALAFLNPLVAEFSNRSDYRENLATAYNNLANALHVMGRAKEAKAAEAQAVVLQKQLVDDFPGIPELRRNAALGLHNMASKQWENGRSREAETSYREALKLLQQLADEFPARPEFRQDLARSQVRLGRLLHATGRLKEAEAASRDGGALLKQLAADVNTRPDFRHGMGASYDSLGLLLVATGRLEEAEAAFVKARDLSKQLADEFPTRHEFRRELATCHGNLANLLRTTGRFKEAEKAHLDGIALHRQLVAEFPDQADFRAGLATSLNNMGYLFCRQKKYAQAEKLYREALAIRKQLVESFADRPDFQHDLAFTHNNLGTLLRETNRTAEAEEAFHKALAIRRKLADSISTRADFRQELARVHNNLAQLLVEKKKEFAEAAKLYEIALTLHQQLAEDMPMVWDYQDDLATTLVNVAIMHNHRQQFARAVALVNKARPHHQAALKASPANLTYRRDYHGNLRVLAWSQFELADHVRLAATADELARFDYEPPNNVCHAARYLGICVELTSKDARLSAARRKELAKGYADKALALLERAVTRGLKDGADAPARLEYRRQIASCYVELGGLLRNGSQPKEVEEAYQKAIELLKHLTKEAPSRTDFRQQLSTSYHDLGILLYDTRRPKEAEEAYRAALEIRKQLVKDFPDRAGYRRDLTLTHNNLGNVMYTTGRLKEAEAEYRAALPLQEKLVAESPTDPVYQNGLAGTLVNLGMVHRDRREYVAAVQFLEKGRPHHQAALEANPKDHTYRLFYRNNVWTLADCCLGLGDHVRLATTAQELARFRYDPASDTYRAGCFLSRCASLAGKDPQLDEAKRKEFAQRYADQAVALLRRAVARGYKNVAQMRGDPELKPLRDREDFQKLLAEFEKKTKE
jgi:tetratricopeptide (TPR) repeat protein